MTHKITMVAFEAAGDPEKYPEAGRALAAAEALLQPGLQPAAHRSRCTRRCWSAAWSRRTASGWSAGSEFEQRERTLTTYVPCADFFEIRDKALIAHATQIDPDGGWFRVPDASAAVDTFRQDQYRTLQSVDQQVEDLIGALRDTGRLANTLIVFTSDNGLSWGEHRWVKKEVPYEESIRVPLVVRYDPLTAGGSPATSSALALNIDIAPTIADAAGVPVSADGRSLLPILGGAGTDGWRTRFLIEHMEGSNPVPTYCALRTDRYLYSRYATGSRSCTTCRRIRSR